MRDVSVELDEHVAYEVHDRVEGFELLGDPRHELLDRAFERAVIVGGSGVVARLEHGKVGSIHAAGIAHHHVVDGLAVE